MRKYKTTAALALALALLVVTVQSLPLNSPNSNENSETSSDESNESPEAKSIKKRSSNDVLTSSEENFESIERVNQQTAQLILQQIIEEQRYINQVLAEISELSDEETDSRLTNSDSVEENIDATDNRILKRSPDIPDPDMHKGKEHDYQPDVPGGHSTHDEYLEWKSQQPRYRRNLDDDSFDADYQDVQPVVENSLEDYAQGCEVIVENSDENNETTYDDYRRKRSVSQEEEQVSKSEDEDGDHDRDDADADVDADLEKEEKAKPESEEKSEAEPQQASESESDSEYESEPEIETETEIETESESESVVQIDETELSKASETAVENAEEPSSNDEANPKNDEDESIPNSSEPQSNDSDSLSVNSSNDQSIADDVSQE